MRSWSLAPWQLRAAVVLLALQLCGGAAALLLAIDDPVVLAEAETILEGTVEASGAVLKALLSSVARTAYAVLVVLLAVLALRTVQRGRWCWGALVALTAVGLLRLPRPDPLDLAFWVAQTAVLVLLLLPPSRRWALGGRRWGSRPSPEGARWPAGDGLQRPD